MLAERQVPYAVNRDLSLLIRGIGAYRLLEFAVQIDVDVPSGFGRFSQKIYTRTFKLMFETHLAFFPVMNIA
ncbi:hypothetical protein D3C74_308730 [compost metagenome]